MDFVVCLNLYLNLVFVVSAGFFHKIGKSPVSKTKIIKSVSGVSKIQCLLRCRRHKRCKEIAFGEGGTCMLLENSIDEKYQSTINAKEHVDAKRILPMPGKVQYYPLPCLVYRILECMTKNKDSS